ncbi:acyltransferase [Leptospira perolatii]|uniref:Acyltransferase n=1 Tax=Leptospira perolatii TaxID=2023191 RepID=A0A2M9ZI45_9LEPT|nr:MBOAT family O-acyltransferase [Leptospira perolatii]PJZ68116.1 acyltransferase [Leptospira perolatii]PJZ71737.1 acyltransferase [Leptospira perolatii]
MLFNSVLFLLFFAVVYVIYWSLPKTWKLDFLLLASGVFYLFSGKAFFVHFIFVILLNYLGYYKVKTSKNKKFWVTFSVLFNVINLGFFKYFYFINKILADLTGYPFFSEVPRILKISLPLAVSFYSFQMIAAVVDAYRKPEEERITLKKYFSFVLFFPVLIAGPILRTSDFFPNLERLEPSKDKIVRACYLMMSGLSKKLLVADPVASLIAPVFAGPSQYDNLSLVLAAFGYAVQVYCDFSGLTDMARSVGLFIGIDLPENFKAPLFSSTGKELWQRWHITLSFWLRDYIYFSLGGSRAGEWRTYLNLILTMTIGGIWHGADYTYATWGFYWGVILAFERFLEKRFGYGLNESSNSLLHILKVLFIFSLFSFSAVLFRADSASTMVQHVAGLFTNLPGSFAHKLQGNGFGWLESAGVLASGPDAFQLLRLENIERLLYAYLAFLMFHFLQFKVSAVEKFGKNKDWLLVICGVATVFLLTLFSEDSGAFIYYKF